MEERTKICPTCAQTIKAEAIICRFCKHDFRGTMSPPVPPHPLPSAGLGPVLLVVIVVAVVVVMVIGVVAAIAIPGLLAASRASNERNASASLKTITTAQADFRSNDRDGNLVADFWTADVYGLHGMLPVPEGNQDVPADTSNTSQAIRLIEPSVACADGQSRTQLYGNAHLGVRGSPKAAYVYRAFALENDTTLLNDTDGPKYYGLVHDRSRFAFAAFPESLPAGKLMFLVNADNTIWMYGLPASYAATFSPLDGRTESSSSTRGTGQSQFDFSGPGTGDYPASPGTYGCSKMD